MTDTPFMIAPAEDQDVPEITAVLDQSHLLTYDLLAPRTRYWVIRDEEQRIVATAGLEFGDRAALLRSVAVLPCARSQGLAHVLADHAFHEAQSSGCEAVYLFSVHAGGYWQRMGFEEVPVDEMVEALPDVPQVNRFRQIHKLETEIAWKKRLE
jgi:N-acetylglutamate synthase-like GNAT family acetyltransferase